MNLDNAITEYINNVEWKKSFLLHGPWGAGKTHYLKNFFTSKSNINKLQNHTHYCFVNGYDITEDFNLKKYIFNNSYKIGTRDLDPIVNDVIAKMQKNYDKLPFWIKNTISAIEKGTKVAAKTHGIELEVSGILSKFFDEHIEYICQSPKIKECIVIIDELDRNTNTDIKIIFSKVIDLLENLNMKVILVAQSESLELNEDVKLWSEKVIDFKVKHTSNENKKIDDYISIFSTEFQAYFKKNRESFYNYRTYERYLSFEKVINNKYKKYDSMPSKMGLINDFREIVFYVLFMTENPTLFKQEYNSEKNELAPYLAYHNMKEVISFISLNYVPLFSKLDKLLQDEKSPSVLLRDLYMEYKKSKIVCHAKHKEYTIINPEKYIVDLIDTYLNHLNMLSPEPVTRINPYTDLSYWINELSLYQKNDSLISKILDLTKSKFNSNLLTEYNSIRSKIIFLNKDINKILDNYKREYSLYPEFIKYVEIKIKDKKLAINKELQNYSLLEDDEIIVKHFIDNVENIFEKILAESDNYYYDLSLFFKYEPEWYENAIEDYVKKYPDENSRIIKDYVLSYIKSKE